MLPPGVDVFSHFIFQFATVSLSALCMALALGFPNDKIYGT